MSHNTILPPRTIKRRMQDIIKAAERGDLAGIVAALDEDPASINQTDTKAGLTALHVVAANCNKELVSYLLSVPGVDITLKDAFGREALDIAIQLGQNKAIIEIISRKRYPRSFVIESPDGPK